MDMLLTNVYLPGSAEVNIVNTAVFFCMEKCKVWKTQMMYIGTSRKVS